MEKDKVDIFKVVLVVVKYVATALLGALGYSTLS